MDRGEISILSLLDQSKCFDVVPHKIMLDKLTMYGIETEWFDSYLSDHTQQVLIRGSDGTSVKSKPKNNTIGVFQGGSVSCVLYMLFSNDLCLHAQDNMTFVQYADDVQILISGKKQHLNQLIASMEGTLDSLFQWFCQHSMKVNEKKTQMIVLGTPAMLKGMAPVSITFNGSQIPQSATVQNLGVVFDKHLNFQEHISLVTRKCTGTLIALSHARHVIPSTTLPCLVQALVISMVRYCLSVYGSCSQTQIHRIQKILNFGARVVSGRKSREHISDVISSLGWMNSQQLIDYHTVCAIHTALTTGQPSDISRTIGHTASQRHDHDTRQANRLTLPSIRTEAGRRRLCYRGVTLFNELGVTSDQNNIRFRRTLRSKILSR